VGVYTHANGHTYAGERNERGLAHGEGVVTQSDGTTLSGQLADGRWHGHRERHCADGDVDYELCERGNFVHTARVRPDGACFYDNEPCGADRADFAKLKDAAQRAAVRTPPTRIQRNARAVGRNRDARAVAVFALRSFLVPRLGPRLFACVCKCARVYVCVRLGVRVPARSWVCACACVHDRVWVCVIRCARVSVHMRLGVRERVYECEFVYVCA
jgi:hypothetical protein